MQGARQIGFTVLSISISLIAAFIPVLFMSGIVGRLLREFSVTLAVAIAVSLVVSLSVTPMICAHFLKEAPDARATRFDRIVEGALGWMVRGYARTLTIALRHQAVMLFTLICVVVLTVHLYIQTPKGFFPEDDTGLIITSTKAAADISFDAMAKLQKQALDIILDDPAVEHVGSSVGASGFNASINRGRMFINLKPLNERGGVTTRRVINRLRDKLANIYGLEVRMYPSRDIRVGARQGDSEYQFTLWDPDIDELYAWAPKVLERMKSSRASSTCRTTATRAACSSTSRSTATPPRGSACRSPTSTTRSTTPSPSARSRPSTPSATSTASFSRSTPGCSAIPPISSTCTCRAAPARRCR